MTVAPERTERTSGFTVTVARSVDDVLALRDLWLDGPNIATGIDFFLTVVRERGRDARPHVVVVSEHGEVVALLVARMEQLPVRCRIGYWTVVQPTLKTIVVAHGGFVGDVRAAPNAMESLRDSVSAREAEAIFIPSLRIDSPLHRAAADVRGLRRQRGIQPSVHHALELPPSFEQFLAGRSAKSRGTLRRYAKRLETDFADSLRLERHGEPADIDETIHALREISAKSYQSGIGVGFEGTALERSLMRTTMEQGQFEAHVLYIADTPVAFWQGYVDGTVYRTGYTGFDPAYGEYRVGTYVLLRLIEACCENPAVSSIDFGVGAADYKERFGTTSWLDIDMFFYGPGLRPAMVAVARAVTSEANNILVALARRLESMRKLKRWWRRRQTAT